MYPATVLCFRNGSAIDELTAQWLTAYNDIAKNYPEKEGITDMLKERILNAASLLKRGDISDNKSLDTDLPLGNERDMRFASRFFDIDELAFIQAGYPWLASFPRYAEYDDENNIRRGFTEEMRNEYTEALRCYNKVTDWQLICERIEYVQKRNDEEAELFLQKAKAIIRTGKTNDPDIAYYLMRSADMGNPEAQVEYALTEAYGLYGSGTCAEEAAEYMQRAADAGDERAIAFLEDGFAEKTERDFTLELAEEGDARAMYRMVKICERSGDMEEAADWLDMAVDAEYPDALYYAACEYMKYSDPELQKLAAEYLYTAAIANHAKAMYKCAQQLELCSYPKKNGKLITRLYEKAADAGIIDAAERLYRIYTSGTAFAEPDKRKASYYAFITGRSRE